MFERLPGGVVTFLFTDIEGSTALWEESPAAMATALAHHDRIIDAVLEENGGISVKPRGEGDSRFVVFANAVDAAQAVADIQRSLADHDWKLSRSLQVRASLHTGEAELQLGDYYGPAVNRAARIRAIAHGGQTVMSGSTYELVQDRLPEGVTCRDMGQHALKDLTRPEHIYQLDIEGLRSDFPPLRSLDSVANNLPLQLTEFIGRESELSEAKKLLTATRLLTVLAPGGTGKTRLAIQAGADLSTDYTDGVFFVDMSVLDSSQQIIQAIADAIGLVFSVDTADEAQLHRYLVNREMLLILDNLEHLSGGYRIIADLLQKASAVRVLATSRSRLGLSAETVLPLGGMETTWDSADIALQKSGVRLFLDAARRSAPDFSLDAADLDPLARILSMTGGVPLGIVLAAAWTDMLPIGAIADEISKSLDFLETEMGDVPDRHRSVRAVFEYSWELLSEEERDAFAALSVFRGGFTREAAAQVSGASIRQLANLASKSLLTADPEAGRYTVHELLRQYAAGILEEDGERFAEIEEAHASYYRDLTVEAFSLFPVADHLKVMEIVGVDIDNIRSAWRHLVKHGESASLRQMTPAVHVFHELRSRYPNGVALFQEAIDGLSGESDPESEKMVALAMTIQTWFRSLLGTPDADRGLEACSTLRTAGDPMALWLGLQGAALGCSYEGRVEEMIEITDEAIETATLMGDDYWVAGGKNWRSLAALSGGDLETASELLDDAEAVFASRNDHYFLSWTLLLQALVAGMQGRADDAVAYYKRQVETCREVGYLRGTLLGLEGLGRSHFASGDFEGARRAFTESLAIAEQTSMIFDILGLMAKVGDVFRLMGDAGQAVSLLATVEANPHAGGHTMTDPKTALELAESPLSALRDELEPDVFEAAVAVGRERSYEDALKELLST